MNEKQNLIFKSTNLLKPGCLPQASILLDRVNGQDMNKTDKMA